MSRNLFRSALALALALAAAPAAHAGDLSLGIVLGGERGRLAVSYGNACAPLVRAGAVRHACGPVYAPAHYESVERRVWVPAAREKVWVDAVYSTRYDRCGRPYRVLVCPGRWTVRVHPGHYETRCERVWVPAGYQPHCG